MLTCKIILEKRNTFRKSIIHDRFLCCRVCRAWKSVDKEAWERHHTSCRVTWSHHLTLSVNRAQGVHSGHSHGVSSDIHDILGICTTMSCILSCITKMRAELKNLLQGIYLYITWTHFGNVSGTVIEFLVYEKIKGTWQANRNCRVCRVCRACWEGCPVVGWKIWSYHCREREQ